VYGAGNSTGAGAPLGRWEPGSVSFDEFVAARLPAFLRYAAALACDPHLAEDIVQDVLIKVQRRWKRIAGMDVPETYVRRMITNEYLSWRRRKSAATVAMPPDELALASYSLADPARQYDERDAMLARLAALPRKQRAVLVLRYYCGLTDEEIAETLGCSHGTVRSHASRALAALRVRASEEFTPIMRKVG
jgi:RNA polymerase sigma-70 factor (sigma-E family)